jgi:hypothetical protein
MKDVHEVLQQKEADVADVRREIDSLRIVAQILSNEQHLEDPYKFLQQKEAELTRVRQEVASLHIVARLLADESAPDEPTKKPASSVQEPFEGETPKATGTEGLFSSLSASPRPKFWKLLSGKRKH